MFLKNKKNIFKIRRSKVTDYAALSYHVSLRSLFCLILSGRFTKVLLYLFIMLKNVNAIK